MSAAKSADSSADYWAPSDPSPAPSAPAPPSRDMIEAARAARVDGPRSTGPARPTSAPVPVVKGSDPQSRARAQRMLVYTADLVMAVYDVAGSLDRIERLAGELGGFLASREDRSILIRVPAERFAEAMERLRPIGDVLHRAVSVEDVKDAYVDLETRLRNARATRDRIERLLAQTSNVGEILQIEQQLRRITDEIEGLEGKIKGLRDRVALASIRVVFQPRGREDVKKGPFELPFRWLDRLGLSRLLELR